VTNAVAEHVKAYGARTLSVKDMAFGILGDPIRRAGFAAMTLGICKQSYTCKRHFTTYIYAQTSFCFGRQKIQTKLLKTNQQPTSPEAPNRRQEQRQSDQLRRCKQVSVVFCAHVPMYIAIYAGMNITLHVQVQGRRRAAGPPQVTLGFTLGYQGRTKTFDLTRESGFLRNH
jgi:hypothetical protein